MESFYSSRFPLIEICQFITCNWKYNLKDIEFAFGDYYKRRDKLGLKLSFQTPTDLLLYLKKNTPNTFQWCYEKKPLCLDMDMDDYYPDMKRSCNCKQGACCDVCWVEIARKPLKDCLEMCRFYGFNKVLPIFSGGRGFWIIIYDEEVWDWDSEARTSFVNRVPARIDKGVTTQMTHLMKIPYTPHRRTGKICIPIENPDTFVPSQAPHFNDFEKKKIKFY